MSEDFTQSIPHKMAKAIKLKRQIVDRQLAALSLPRSHWQTIAWLNISGMPCTQQDLLKVTEFDCGQLARILDQLEKKGIIIRTAMAEDRRVKQINFTKNGCVYAEKINDAMYSEIKFMLKNFSKEEKASLDRLLNKVLQNLYSELEHKA